MAELIGLRIGRPLGWLPGGDDQRPLEMNARRRLNAERVAVVNDDTGMVPITAARATKGRRVVGER